VNQLERAARAIAANSSEFDCTADNWERAVPLAKIVIAAMSDEEENERDPLLSVRRVDI
jgi:hypothetical protein